MSNFITQKEQNDLDNMLCEQFRKRNKPKRRKKKMVKRWKKCGRSGNQYEKGNKFTAISRPVYQDKFLVTTGDRTKPKSIKRIWVKTKTIANKKVSNYRKKN